MVIDMEKSQDLPSASCRLRMASGAVPVQVQELWARGINGVSPSLAQKTQDPEVLEFKGKRRFLAQVKRAHSPFLNLYILFRPQHIEW